MDAETDLLRREVCAQAALLAEVFVLLDELISMVEAMAARLDEGVPIP